MPASIRSRLLLLMLAVLVPAVAAALSMVVQTYRNEQVVIERNLRDTTRAMTMVVERELTQRATIARVLSVSRTLDSAPRLTEEQLRAFDIEARRAMVGLSGWVELVSTEGTLLSTAQQSAQVPAGAVVKPPEPLLEAASVQPLSDHADGTGLHASVVHPVRHGSELVLNVVVTLVPAELQAVIAEQQTPAGWLGTVVDSQGIVVARRPGGARFAGQSATADLRQALERQTEGLMDSVSLDGQPTTVLFSTSAQGWAFVGGIPRETVAGMAPAVWKLGLGALALLLIATAGALGVTQHIVGPLQSLRRAAGQLRAGEPVNVARTGIAEIDHVAAALTEAGSSIREASTELERQVAAAVKGTREAEQRASQGQRVEALGRLTGGVAHDFNNLLGVISNSAHLMQRLQTGQTLQAPIDATLRAVEVGSRLTRQLLRFAGRQPLQRQRVDLGQYLPEVQELVQTVLGKRIEISTRVEPGTHEVTVDQSELELALINLCLNARDALPAGGHLWIEARNAGLDERAELSAREQVLLSVTDDGQGIDEPVLERVFEPFFTTKPVGKGTGLGLSQVHGFCVQSGGTARVDSTRGLGTTVTLVLPAAQVDDERSPPCSPAAVAQAPGPDALGGRRVLLVEDNEELAHVTSALLLTFGCTVLWARDPKDALQIIEGGAALDIVLSDIVMPGDFDGLGLAQRLRTQRPELPVVLISGYSEAVLSAHDFVVLSKPTTPEQLVATLRAALKQAEQHNSKMMAAVAA